MNNLAKAINAVAWAFRLALRIIAVGIAMCIIGAVLWFGTWIAYDLLRWFYWMNPALGVGSALGMVMVVALVGKWIMEGVRWAHRKVRNA